MPLHRVHTGFYGPQPSVGGFEMPRSIAELPIPMTNHAEDALAPMHRVHMDLYATLTGSQCTACHVRRALYGLRQAPRRWHACLKQALESCGFAAADADLGLFVERTWAAHSFYWCMSTTS